MTLASYLPQDRRRALAAGQTLPSRAYGSVLFADISGFTPFTEALHHAYGPRRGAEELSKHLDAVYTTLIAEVERYNGSVTGFAGDAITCWFDETDGPAPLRAVTCATALQTAMQAFAKISLPEGEVGRLAIKVGLATGEVRRLVVGDEADYWLDVLAGETVNHMAVAEQLATAPDILLDEATVTALGGTITLAEWRTSDETGQRFGVLGDLTAVVDLSTPAPLPELDEETTRPWLNPLVYARAQTGHPLLQTDFRPCVALFIRFVGIDYEADTAADQLNQFIRPLQAILAQYEGTLIDLTFGDKGSYAYINFGALSIHEDDARRAVKTALRLREVAQTLPFLEPVQIGITSGVMRTGAYGGLTRRHYGALGDEVNVAARLMSTAVDDQILVSGRIHDQLRASFLFGLGQQLRLKGKREPLTVFPLYYEVEQRPIHLPEPSYNMPIVGREAEQSLIVAKLGLAQQGQAQIVALMGEAGLGKSRLALQAVSLAFRHGFTSYGGACQADGLNTPYLVWKQIALSFFGLNPHQPPPTQIQQLQTQVRRYAPERVEALPLLGRLLDLPIPENSFTEGLEPKNRQTALHALLEDCLKRASQEAPLLLVIEDLHWIDALSHDLLVELAQALTDFPLLFLLVYRPTDLPRLQAPRLEARPNFTPIPLSAFNETEARQMIQAKLSQLYPTRGRDVSPMLVQKLLARAEGNPFYLEEVLNFFHGRGLDPRDETSWETELPDSLHALILSRLDQLQPSQQRTMRVASVIGRLFSVAWLIGYYPALGDLPQVQTDLAVLHTLDLTLLDSSEPELAYLFKHIITHEVTYESLPYATRARLHEQLAAYLERVYTETVPLEMLAFHYGRSDNIAKQVEYFRRAGEAAQKNFANEAALAFYERLLLLVSEPEAQISIRLQCGEVLEVIGKWEEAERSYRTALALADKNTTKQSEAQFALGRLSRQRGEYETSLNWLAQARAIQTASHDHAGLTKSLIETGTALWRQGNYVEARAWLTEGLTLARATGDTESVAGALNSLGSVAWLQSDYGTARTLHETSLSLRRERGHKAGIAASLNNLGILTLQQGDYDTARVLLEESLTLRREMGDKRGITAVLTNLGVWAMSQGDYPTTWRLNEECLLVHREMGDKGGIAGSLCNLGFVAVEQNDYAEARDLLEDSLNLYREIGDKNGEAYALIGLGLVALAENKPAEAREQILHSLRLRVALGEQLTQASTLVAVAGLAWQAGDALGAARWLGAVASALKVLGAPLEGDVIHFHARTLAAVQAQLGEAAFQLAWEEGGQWSLEEAVKKALEENA